jgi:hypothetical protein
VNKISSIIFFNFLLILLTGCDGLKIQEKDKLVIDPSLCQFSTGECWQNVADLQVGLLIDPVNAPSEKPLIITLKSNQAITNISMRLEGRDMFMGVIPVSLSEIKHKVYQGSLIFGSCSSNYMVWRAKVSFEHKGISHSVWFDFLADAQQKSAR